MFHIQSQRMPNGITPTADKHFIVRGGAVLCDSIGITLGIALDVMIKSDVILTLVMYHLMCLVQR